jgi:hypothetical protein
MGARSAPVRLEETGKRIRVRGHLLGWPLDRVVDEIRRACADCSLLEANRLAHGLTRQQLSWAIDTLYEGDGLAPPHLDPSDIWAWERGRHQPTPEHQRYLTRAYRTRPDRLGFGEDHSPGAREETEGPALTQARVEASVVPDQVAAPGPAQADELVIVITPGVRSVSLRLPTPIRPGVEWWAVPDRSGWSPQPGAIVGLAEERIEIVVDDGRERGVPGREAPPRPEHGVKVMDRRAFLTLGIALPVALTVEHLERLRDALTTCRVDALAVEGLERIGAGCRLASDHLPAPELLPHVAWQIRLLEGLRPSSPALRPRIVNLIGSLAAMAGRMTFWDLQDPRGAEGYFQTALTAAQETDNRELAAYTLAGWSFVAASRTARLTTAYGNGPLTGALSMVEEARRLATASGSPITEAYVATLASEIHACDGDEAGSRRSVERAAGALSRRAENAPPWIGHGRFDALKIRTYDAANLVRFGKPEAVDALRSTLDQYGPERRKSRCYGTANLARALVQQDDIVEGALCSGDALTLASELGSRENIRRIRTFYGEDLRGHRDHPAVRALGDRLAEL